MSGEERELRSPKGLLKQLKMKFFTQISSFYKTKESLKRQIDGHLLWEHHFAKVSMNISSFLKFRFLNQVQGQFPLHWIDNWSVPINSFTESLSRHFTIRTWLFFPLHCIPYFTIFLLLKFSTSPCLRRTSLFLLDLKPWNT